MEHLWWTHLYKSVMRPHLGYKDVDFDKDSNNYFLGTLDGIINTALILTATNRVNLSEKLYQELILEPMWSRRIFKSAFTFQNLENLAQIFRTRYFKTKNNGNLIPFTLSLMSPTIIFIMFWDFLTVEQIFISPQVKQSVVISNKLVCKSRIRDA